MGLFALLLLIAFVLIAYHSGGHDLLSPWFLLCFVFCASFCIVLINYANWDVKINYLFIVYVCTALASFGVGCAIKGKPLTKQEARLPLLFTKRQRKNYPALSFAVLSVGLLALYAFKILSDNYVASSFSATLRAIYDKSVKGYSPGILFTQMREVIVAIAYISAYKLLLKMFGRKGNTPYFLVVVPIVCFLFLVLLTTDRNIFLRFAIYFLCLYIVLYRAHCKKRHVNARILKWLIGFGICIVAVFFIMGRLKQYQSDLFNSISIYAGSGLYNFNLWLVDFQGPLLYGKAVFSTLMRVVQAVFGKIGVHLNLPALDRFDPFITYTSPNGYEYSSNIYTALKPFVNDFGYFGVIFFPFIMGVFYQWLYRWARRNKSGFSLILYAALVYPIIFYPILDQFFARLTLGVVYELVWLAIIYEVAFGTRQPHGSAVGMQTAQGVNHG